MTADHQAAVDAALAELDAAAARAAELVPGAPSSGWASLIGASSTVDAMRADAAATATLAATMHARAAVLTDDEVPDFLRAAGAGSDTSNMEAVNSLLLPSTAAADVASGAASDLAGAARSVGDGWLSVLKASPYILAGLAVLLVWSWARPRR